MNESDTVRVSSLSRARKLKRKFAGVLSLHDLDLPASRRLRFHRDPQLPHLTLLFDDCEDPALAERGWTLATREQVAEGLAFARALEGSLLVHCHAGVSRSGAMALAVLADLLGPGRESEAMDRLLAVRSEAVPNGLVVRLADDVLGRNGALVKVYEERLAQMPSWTLRKTLQRKTFEHYTPADFRKYDSAGNAYAQASLVLNPPAKR